jgi:hypothetical protein
MARQCGLRLYQILLLNARAEILLESDLASAELSARDALVLASSADCRFGWGEAEAGHLLGQALASQGRYSEALDVIEETLALRTTLNDPARAETERLRNRLPR